MKYFKKLVGEKVYLSPMCIEDIEFYTRCMNDFNTTTYLTTSDKVVTLESEKNWLINCITNSVPFFAIIDIETDEIIGNCGLSNIDTTMRTSEVGIFIGDENYRSKGYGTEALGLLVEYGFRYLNLNSIMLTVYEFNKRAKKSYEKLGFKEFGLRRQARFVNGKYYDIIYMDILEEEFKDSYIKNNVI